MQICDSAMICYTTYSLEAATREHNTVPRADPRTALINALTVLSSELQGLHTWLSDALVRLDTRGCDSWIELK